jgi:hypothetical protein
MHNNKRLAVAVGTALGAMMVVLFFGALRDLAGSSFFTALAVIAGPAGCLLGQNYVYRYFR